MQTMHSNVQISKTGLMISQEHPFLGASADGIGSCDCHGNFLIEIKCPYTLREKKNVGECLGEKNFFLDNDLKLKNGHRYFTQVQMQMAIYNIKACHFVVWNPQYELVSQKLETTNQCKDEKKLQEKNCFATVNSQKVN